MGEKQNSSDKGIAILSDVVTGDVEPQGFDEAATKRLLRRLDWHIIPFMSLIYLSVNLHVHCDAITLIG